MNRKGVRPWLEVMAEEATEAGLDGVPAAEAALGEAQVVAAAPVPKDR